MPASRRVTLPFARRRLQCDPPCAGGGIGRRARLRALGVFGPGEFQALPSAREESAPGGRLAPGPGSPPPRFDAARPPPYADRTDVRPRAKGRIGDLTR